MVLQGLTHSMYLGWIAGVILVKSPRGPFELAPKKRPFSIFLIFLLVANLVMRFDFYMKQNSSLQGESMVVKFLDLSLLMGETVFDWFFRASFIFRSKLVVRFFKNLESDMKKFAPFLQLSHKDKKAWKYFSKLTYFILVCHIISGILVTLWVSRILSQSNSSKGSLFLKFMPQPVYSALFFVFGELPVMCSISVSFTTVIVTTFHVLWIFYDFCESLEEQVYLYNGQENQAFAKQNLGEIDSVFSVAASAIQMQRQDNRRLGGQPMSTDKLVGKLEHLKLVCGQFDKICGPLLLGLIVRAVYVLISSANAILLYENPNQLVEKQSKYALDLFLFVTEMSQLCLLPLGNMFKREIREKKEELTRMVIFMTNLEARTDMRNVMTSFNEWDWCLTGGPGFFIVDRSLLSGVVSSLMTYVTIIFQLNAPTSPDPTSSSPSPDDIVL